MSETPEWKWHYSDISCKEDGESNLWVIWTVYMPGLCGHLWNHTQHCWRGPISHPALHYPPIPLKKKGKNLLNRGAAIKTTAKSMKGQQGWKETKGVRTVSGGQVQQLTQKIVPPLTWKIENWKRKKVKQLKDENIPLLLAVFRKFVSAVAQLPFEMNPTTGWN